MLVYSWWKSKMNVRGNHVNYSSWIIVMPRPRVTQSLREAWLSWLFCLSSHFSSLSIFSVLSNVIINAALCNEDANGNVPLGKSCNRYWSCQGGYPRLQRCPAQLVFDKNSLRCVVPPTEDCDVPATQATPIDEPTNGVSEQRGQVSWRRKIKS